MKRLGTLTLKVDVVTTEGKPVPALSLEQVIDLQDDSATFDMGQVIEQLLNQIEEIQESDQPIVVIE